MKITRMQLKKLLIEAIGDGKFDNNEAADFKALLDEATQSAFDVLYDYLDDRGGGETIKHEELKEIVANSRYDQEAIIPDEAIDAAIKRLEGDGNQTGMLIPSDWADPTRSAGWTIGRYAGYSL